MEPISIDTGFICDISGTCLKEEAIACEVKRFAEP